MNDYSWNRVYNLILRIKYDYINTYGNLDTIKLENWLKRLNNKEYNDIFKALKINQFNEFVLLRYDTLQPGNEIWKDSDSIYRECRSIVINVADDEIVLSPFRKFFNLNEVEENKKENILAKINTAKSIEITDKLDGSLQSGRFYKGKIFLAGSMAMDPANSWRLEDGYRKLSDNHKKMMTENQEFTFIFEYISLKDSHVVMYKSEQEGMYLIGIRNTYTGEQLSYAKVKHIADSYSVGMTKIESKSFDEIINDAAKLKSHEKEGWVINIDGHMIKLKCDDYVCIHRVLNQVSSVNAIIKSIADDSYDDLLSKVPINYRESVEGIAKNVFDYIKIVHKRINEYYDKAPKNDKKKFMVWVSDNSPKEIQGYLRQKFLNREWNVLKTGFGDGKIARYKKPTEIGLDE